MATQTLTIEQIDARLPEINTRLQAISGELEKKNAELGSSSVLKMPTKLIHNAIYRLEKEQRELEAEKAFLTQERDRIQKANAQAALETATAEFESLRGQLTPRAREIIADLLSVYHKVLELEVTLSLMSDVAPTAGKRFNGTDPTVINIPVRDIESSIGRILYFIRDFNGRELLEQLGVQIPDLDEVRQKVIGSDARLDYGISLTVGKRTQQTTRTVQQNDSPMLAAARKGAKLPGK